ncbi:MAG TPA: hypothetical protein VN784_05145 [Candidatus Limnocylindrales bacterium]|nr:hypothetical protein [Candidatus Limnocylindrales bacterium]
MHARSILILGLVAMTSRVWSDEKLPTLKVGGDTYSNVTVTKVTATNIFFISSQGLTNVELKDLDPTSQKHFHYDPANATAEPKQKAGNAQYHFRVRGTNQPSSIAAIKLELADAIARVREIVNQPVESLPRKPDMKVATYSPGWFRPGSEKPDFNRVDVRNTQKFPYDRNEYVTSDLNPKVVYVGPELEFNPMTKYFYTNRAVPKKKLNESEMLEINRLYRIIGQDEDRLAGLRN